MEKRDRRTHEQRRICEAIVWQETGLTKSAYWDDARVLLALIGTSRITTNEKLAAEIGCGLQAIEKTVRRLKRAGLLAKKPNAGGERGRESEYVPAWGILGRIGGERSKASTNSQAKKRSTAKTPKDETPPPPPPAPVTPQWNASTRTLHFGDLSRTFSPQARVPVKIFPLFEEANWPDKISSPFAGDVQRHKDAIDALNTCGFLRFSSVLGTDIRWQKA
jgi:biotin operon repressor